MYDLPIVSRQARDLVERQFAEGDRRGADPRRATRRAGSAATTPRAPLRTVSAAALRALADRLEPRCDARPRSA
jgi:hypothetical protein